VKDYAPDDYGLGNFSVRCKIAEDCRTHPVRVKRQPERAANCSPLFRTEVKNAWSFLFTRLVYCGLTS
jgi:hypothetical protein